MNCFVQICEEVERSWKNCDMELKREIIFINSILFSTLVKCLVVEERYKETRVYEIRVPEN